MGHEHEHRLDIFVGSDGSEERRGPWVVDNDSDLTSSYSGSICVHPGAVFEITRYGHHSGSLTFQPGSVGRIIGKHSGSLHVAEEAHVEVLGDQSGSVHIDAGAVLRVAPSGKLAGTLNVAGVVENRGVRGGSIRLAGGQVHDVDGGAVKQPSTNRDGTSIYRW